jgi:hypothetical protein
MEFLTSPVQSIMGATAIRRSNLCMLKTLYPTIGTAADRAHPLPLREPVNAGRSNHRPRPRSSVNELPKIALGDKRSGRQIESALERFLAATGGLIEDLLQPFP